MGDLSRDDSAQWFAIHTHPKQEYRADSNLRAWNVETFFPQLRERKYGSKRSQRQVVLKPLFSRYLFARFRAADLLYKVRFTRGVHDVVSFGGQPTPVSNEVISMIKLRAEEDGTLTLSEEFEAGSNLMVEEGPLKGFSAIFQKRLNGTSRIMLLLQTVSYQASVIVDSSQVRKMS
ncbi:MAG: transcription termination/antitermination NusG family protein [Pyrinomonadaceae bacterium]